MYSFTNIHTLVGRSKAEVDMQCAYCFEGTQTLGIKAAQDYFFIEGHRSYERISKGDSFIGLADEFVPYIPRSLARLPSNRRIQPAKFQDRIKQHRMCLSCHQKLYRFFLGGLHFPNSCGQRLQVVTRHTMRTYVSMPDREYNCQCCGSHIPGSTLYGRRGIYENICLGCFDLLEKYIGKEFSY